MDKTAIRNFAVKARRKLIEDITHKAYEIGITKDKILDIETFEGGFRVKGRENGKTFKKYELKQRDKLIQNIKHKGFEQVIEEVAYTWFNRFIALRFMEVNNYLPTGVRVLSSIEEGKTEPDIIQEALNIDLDLDPEIVYRLQDSNDTEDLYRYLLVKQCNQLGKIMPSVFEEIADYTELLLPDKLLAEGSVIRDLVEEIEEYDWKIELNEEEQKQEEEKGEHGIEIIGWLYQYYISEKKDEVFAGLKKNKKITKENIPAATQLFTPKWIVKYMVENSLGRLWLESHPNEELKAQWKYYLEEAEQEPEVQKQLDALKDPNLNPEDIKVLDPAMGSGHILVYAFDVLYEIYLSAGYSEREIPTLILEKNLYGLDIDDRAGQLATFALLMKARSKNRRIFRHKPKMNLCSIQESNDIPKEAIEYLVSPKETELEKHFHREDVDYLIEVFHDAKEYGSILDVKKIDFDALEKRIEEIRNNVPEDLFELQYREIILEKIPPLIQQAKIMSQKYDVVCTNPPYMGRKGMNLKLAKYLDENFKDSKTDLFAVFMEVSHKLLIPNGMYSMINQHSWMFISSYLNLREKILSNEITINMLHLGARAFEEIAGEVVQSTAFIQRKLKCDLFRGKYIKLVDLNTSKQKEIHTLDVVKGCNKRVYKCYIKNFKQIPNFTIAYWAGKRLIEIFDREKAIKDYYECKSGIMTGNDSIFVKSWYEVNNKDIKFDARNYNEMHDYKWFPLNKGGGFRRYYGNNEYIVYLKNMGEKIKQISTNYRLRDKEYYFLQGITWSRISTGDISFREVVKGSLFADAGPMVFIRSCKERHYFLALLNSKVVVSILKMLNPTMNYQVTDIENIPLLFDESNEVKILNLVDMNINLCMQDWDSFETSWDFKKHPLLTYKKGVDKIEGAFNNWSAFANQQFNQLKANEEELNRIFIDIYGLQDELTPDVDDKDVTITRIYDSKEDIPESMKGNNYVLTREDVIKSFISYAVGCMFGRYSLDEEGLIYAGGEISDKWLVVSGQYFLKEVVYRYVSEELSRINSMAEVNDFSGGNLQNSEVASEGRDLRPVRSDAAGGGVDSIEHSGGATEEVNQGIHTVSSSSTGFQSGTGNTDLDMYQTEILDAITSGDVSGLVSRGWKNAKLIDWKTIHYILTTNHYNVVKDNIIPIADGDYFEDGILERFVDFVKVSFGEDTLEENLDYIAETLGRKANETSRQAIRRYFLKDFYKDHVRTYKNRPIYWLFDSGRQDGFKALIYMHRYDSSTVARVRTDYLHSLQKKYEAEINHLDILIDSDISQREKAAARKKKEKILKQIEECRLYDEAIAHVANQRIEIDLDDGVKVNYAKFQGVEIPQGKGRKPLKADLLAKI